MAGELPLPVQEYPDDFHTETFGPFAAADIADQVLWVADRACIIDHVDWWMSAAADGPAAFQLFRGVYTVTSEDSVAEMIAAARDVTGVEDLDAETPFVRNEATVQSDENLLEAGNLLVMDVGFGDGGAAWDGSSSSSSGDGQTAVFTSLAGLYIRIRIRSARR